LKVSKQSVEYVDHMGTDLTVVNAARVSFAKESDFEYDLKHDGRVNERLNPRDVKLINYLAKHSHWSPFAHTSVQLRVNAPIFVARQLVKHQVGGVWNEVSRRYVDDEPEFYFPEVWRGKPENAKQGSNGAVHPDSLWGFRSSKEDLDSFLEETLQFYKHLLDGGVAPEQARMILPQNTMTEWYWTGSLMFFARVCKQRLDAHVQQETQEVAKMIDGICADLFPVSWNALKENA